ncbi:hypothetical protein BDV12DRAFT_132797 [Aspergillus spectabilis]
MGRLITESLSRGKRADSSHIPKEPLPRRSPWAMHLYHALCRQSQNYPLDYGKPCPGRKGTTAPKVVIHSWLVMSPTLAVLIYASICLKRDCCRTGMWFLYLIAPPSLRTNAGEVGIGDCGIKNSEFNLPGELGADCADSSDI